MDYFLTILAIQIYWQFKEKLLSVKYLINSFYQIKYKANTAINHEVTVLIYQATNQYQKLNVKNLDCLAKNNI